MQDGDLTEVAPEILELSRDANAWKQQRAAAIRARILGQQNTTTSHDSQGSPQAQYSAAQAQQSQAAVMAQLAALKNRRRNEGSLETPTAPGQVPSAQVSDQEFQHGRSQPVPTQPGGSMSPEGGFLPSALREKLMRAAAARSATQ